jgi:hypothetical protein
MRIAFFFALMGTLATATVGSMGCGLFVGRESDCTEGSCPMGFRCASGTCILITAEEMGPDGGTSEDAGAAADAGLTDSGSPADSGPPMDASLPPDAGAGLDAAQAQDASAPEAGPIADAGPQASDGGIDGGSDAGLPPDAGPPLDAGSTLDSGDAGCPELNVLAPAWINYGDGVGITLNGDDFDTCTHNGAVLANPLGVTLGSYKKSITHTIECTLGATCRRQQEVYVEARCPANASVVDVSGGPIDSLGAWASLSSAVQSTINNSPQNNGCYIIQGPLIIDEIPELTDLSGLLGVVEIKGGLEITANVNLSSLTGLDHLQVISETSTDANDGTLILGKWSGTDGVRGHPALDNLDGLGALREVQGRMQIQYTEADVTYPDGGGDRITGNGVTSLEGLNELRQVHGYFEILDLPNLISASALKRLHTVGATLRLDSLPLLTSLDGFQNLENLTWNLHIGQTGLVDVDELARLSWALSIQITENPSLQNLNGLRNIRNLTGYVILAELPALTSLAPLVNAFNPEIDYLWISDLDAITDLSGLSGIQTIRDAPYGNCGASARANHLCPGSLRIVGNDQLDSLTGLDGLSLVDTEVVITGNAILSDLNLQAAPTAGGPGILIRDNANLARSAACQAATGFSGISDTCLLAPGETTDGGYVFEICGNADGPDCPDAGP